jgi:DNA polymerase-1
MVIPALYKIIIGIDFSQIEPRVLAHFTGDESMIGAYVEKRDLYIEMAMKVFKLERHYCEDKAYEPNGKFQPRKAIKSVLLGIMYGMGYKSLAQQVGVSDDEAKRIIEDFYEAFPKVKIWMDEQIKFAEENEYIETMFGRKRRFVGFKMIAKKYHKLAKEIMDIVGHIPDFIWDEEYYELLPYKLKREFWDVSKVYGAIVRKIVNTIIQGSSADIMKLAMIETAKICRLKGYKMLGTIHDEILFEVSAEITREEIEALEQAMLNVVKLKTPFKVDTAFMNRWGKETGKEEWFSKAS